MMNRISKSLTQAEKLKTSWHSTQEG